MIGNQSLDQHFFFFFSWSKVKKIPLSLLSSSYSPPATAASIPVSDNHNLNYCSALIMLDMLCCYADLEAVCRALMQNSLTVPSLIYTQGRCRNPQLQFSKSRLLNFILIWANAVGAKLSRPIFLMAVCCMPLIKILIWCGWYECVSISCRINEFKQQNMPAQQCQYLL